MEFAEVITRPRIDGVVVRKLLRNDSFRGSVVITGHHLIFQSDSDGSQNAAWLLLHKSIDFVITEPKSQLNASGFLILKCKNFLPVTIEFFSSYDDCLAVAKSIEILSNLSDVKLHYPFFYQLSFRICENGWEAFNVEEDEFTRLQTQSDFWRVSYVNKGYVLCSTYPEEVIVPKSISDDQLRASAQFRDGGRFPVLSYIHKETRAVVVRCSQPMVGNNRRCKEDEQLLNAMLNSSNRGYIIDTRSYNFALAAKSKEMHYPRWKRVHKTTPRWQQLQDSMARLIEACNDSGISSDKWLSKLNSSNWLRHVADVLNCACVAAQCVDRKEMSVIVHGTEGTDSTLLVVSLVQVILDPDSRSIRGFESLIEREWIKGGHPFSSRCAHLAYGKSKKAVIPEAPTFLLFLDCVWQSTAEYFRSYLNRPEVLQQYLNPFFDPNRNALWPSIAPQSIELWQRMYCRWSRNWQTIDSEFATLMRLKDEEKMIYSQVLQLQRQLSALEKERSTVLVGN